MDLSENPSNQLTILAALITNAAHAAERQLSAPQSSDAKMESQLRTAIYTLEAACAQLCSLVARPADTLVNKFMAFLEPACIHVALSNKIPDILQDHPSGMHISEMEKQTGVDQGKLGRILRLLATKQIFREVDKDVYANNRLSEQLISSNPLHSFGLHITDECFKAASVLNDTFHTPESAASSLPEDSAFSKYFGIKGTLFDYYSGSSPDQLRRAARFGPAMMGWGAAIEAEAVVYDFPWTGLKAGSTVCDVGGGVGNITMQLAKHYPGLHLILQDRPEEIDTAQHKIWPERCPEAITDGRIEFIPLDFFSDSPKRDCDIYFLKNVLHDWRDEDCVKILKGVRKAMNKQSRVLIHEFIVQPAYRLPENEARFTQAPEPLLPNYGDARIRQYAMDINMMVLLNSRERALDDFIKLGDAAGLRYVKLWETGEMGLIEFTL